jgi:flagellar basal-body rod protein FlgB
MSSIFLFNIASQRNQWLSLRQETIAGNVANANTPGYAAHDVQPFEAVLQSSRLELATTDPAHVVQPAQQLSNVEEKQEDNWQVYDSGNSVSLEKEMVKAGEINGAFALNNNVIKTFHRMLLSSTKG